MLLRFFRGAGGIAFLSDVAHFVAHAPEHPRESSKHATSHKRAFQAHISSAVASAVLPRRRLLSLDSYAIQQVLQLPLL